MLLLQAAAFKVFQLDKPTAKEPYIKGLLDPCTNSLTAPNIPAQKLYDKQVCWPIPPAAGHCAPTAWHRSSESMQMSTCLLVHYHHPARHGMHLSRSPGLQASLTV